MTAHLERRKSGSWRTGPYLARLILGGILVYAGIAKALDPSSFDADLAKYHLLPDSWRTAVSYYLPYLEIVTGGSLISGFFLSGALAVSGALLGGFLFFLLSALARGLDIHCGCFGTASAGSSVGASVLLDCVLVLIWAGLVRSFSRETRAAAE